MKADIFTFERTEMKFLLTPFQYARLLDEIMNNIKPDDYPESHILNIYYDTPNDYLIRRSLEKPAYKEKLRLRAYGVPEDGAAPAFLEIKKKYDGIVYKRRIALPYGAALSYMKGNGSLAEYVDIESAAQPAKTGHSVHSASADENTCVLRGDAKKVYTDRQIEHEIDAFRKRYTALLPRMVISYDRRSYVARNDSRLRITFDQNIRYRSTALDLSCGAWGKSLLEDGYVLMEVKAAGAIPLAFARTLSHLSIRQTSFSKYGAAYTEELTAAQQPSDFAVDKSKMPLYNLA